MELRFTQDIEAYAAAVTAFLDEDPAERNVPRTVIEQARRGRTGWTAPAGLWWVVDGGAVTATAHWTPPFPLLVTEMPRDVVEELARRVVERSSIISVPCSEVHGPRGAAETVAAAVAAASGRQWSEHQTMLLHECTDVLHVPVPPGNHASASHGDVARLVRWLHAFGEEAKTSVPADPEPWVRDMVEQRLLDVWIDAGELVSFAGHRQPVAGVVRVGPVYTPPEHRNRGYARRLAQETTARALQRRDVQRCVLFTDAANPVSNSIYAQAGYRAVSEHVELHLE